MDSSDLPTGRPSPRRELQGPRPAPLKVRKDSYKVKKPPVVPVPSHPSRPPLPPQHPRAPVIIYAVSPKVIHTNPSDFMTLVQRLTGPTAASSSSSSDPSLPSPSYGGGGGGAPSPAARLAAFEGSASSPHSDRQRKTGGLDATYLAADVDMGSGAAALDRSGPFPGILSPVPSSLPPISPSFFSPSFDYNALSCFLHELSPALQGGGAAKGLAAESNFLVSPNNFLSTPTLPSPGSYWDLFNQFQDP